MKFRHQQTCSPGGFTLIEVMIALAVLTIGLTGLAAMQLSAMQYSHSSHYRSLASTIALDFEERLWLELADNDLACGTDWSTKVGVLAADWNRAYLAAEEDGDEGEEEGEAVSQMLRIPTLVISNGTASTAGSTVTVPITLSWTEARFGDTETTTETFSYNVRIQCTPA